MSSKTDGTVYGTPINQKGEVIVLTKTSNKRNTVPVSIMDYWNERVINDLDARISLDGEWQKNIELVANSGRGQLEGNLVAEFVKTTNARLLDDNINVEVTSMNPQYMGDAENAETVAQAVVNITDLKDEAKTAIRFATACSYGVFEIGHPMDPTNMDPQRSLSAPATEGEDPFAEDEYEEVDPAEMDKLGFSLEDLGSFTEELPPETLDNKAKPVFSPTFGYPYVESVDPRLIVMPVGTINPKKAGYIARLRFLTTEEIKVVQNVEIPNSCGIGQYGTLFQEIEHDGDHSIYDNITIVV